MRPSRRHRTGGFTLIELISVLVIMGVMAGLSAVRFFDRSAFDNSAFQSQTIEFLRFAQKAAIAQHAFVCVTFASQSITLTIGATNTCGSALANPAGGASATLSPGGGNAAAFSPKPTNFSFDCMGVPRSAGTGLCGDTAGVLSVTQTVQVANAAAITVEPQTGYVH